MSLGPVACWFVVSASEHEPVDPAVRDFIARVDQVEREIRSGGAPDWAGEYYLGDGLGGNFMVHVAPGAGYAWIGSGCVGTSTPELGSVTAEGDILVLRSLATASGAPPGRRLRIVRWNNRRYLIDDSRMVEFLEAIRFRDEPRREIHGRFYLRVGDEEELPLGMPGLREDELEHAYAPTYVLRVVRVEFDSCSSPEVSRCNPRLRFVVARTSDLHIHEGQAFAVYGPHHDGRRAAVRQINDAVVTLDLRVYCVRCVEPRTLDPDLWTLQSGPR